GQIHTSTMSVCLTPTGSLLRSAAIGLTRGQLSFFVKVLFSTAFGGLRGRHRDRSGYSKRSVGHGRAIGRGRVVSRGRPLGAQQADRRSRAATRPRVGSRPCPGTCPSALHLRTRSRPSPDTPSSPFLTPALP